MSKKGWLLTWIAALSTILFFAGKAHAQQHYKMNDTLSEPLPPDHPDAQLDPSLLNVPPIPEPQEDSNNIFSTEVPSREVGYDVDTSSIQISPINPIQPTSSPIVSPPNFGTDGNIESEPFR